MGSQAILPLRWVLTASIFVTGGDPVRVSVIFVQ
jgi:hypothetical protein